MRTGDTVYITFPTNEQNTKLEWTCPICLRACPIKAVQAAMQCHWCRSMFATLGHSWVYTQDSEEAKGLPFAEKRYREITVQGWKSRNCNLLHRGYQVTCIKAKIPTREEILIDLEPENTLENFDEPTEEEIQAALDALWGTEELVNLGDLTPPTSQSMMDEINRLGRSRQ